MTVTVQLKLIPGAEQSNALEATLRRCNEAADWLSERAFLNETFTQYALQCGYYRELREKFGMGAQAACLVCAKVGDAYKLDTDTQRKFRPLGSMAFDIRNLKIHLEKQIVSIWTLAGREKVPFRCGDYQRELLRKGLIKQSDLVRRRDGKWFLMVSVVLPDDEELKVTDLLGVDMGIAEIAADSDGNKHSGSALNKIRHRNHSLRKKLQRKGTKSAKRLLKKRSRKEALFARDCNHVISKKIVLLAKRTNRAIAIEDLKDIGRRIRVRKSQRYGLKSWAFLQLGQFIAYKAQGAGVPVLFIDPANTSQRCSHCGHTERANRKSRSEFSCKKCGHTSHADTNGSQNIRLKGLEVLRTGAFIRPHAEATTYAN
jgi:IS605 OrfB family transposase